MSTPIFLKYVRHPGYPFDDWPDDIASFHALLSFWSEVFRADVIGAAEDFVPMYEIEQNPDGPIFAVVSRDGRRGFRVTHVSQALGPSHSGFFVGNRLGPDYQPLDDAVTLEVGTDFYENRIEAIRSLMREQLNGKPRSLDVRNDEIDSFIEAHADLFPAMVRSTRANREKRRQEEPDE